MINYNNKKSNYQSRDYRSLNFSGVWSRHFINDYVDNLIDHGVITTQDKLANHKDEHLPKFLYKFYSASVYSLINIENQSIYLSSPKNFNDPFDSFVFIEGETFKKKYLINKLKKLNLITTEESKDSLSVKESYRILNSWSKEKDPPYNFRTPKRDIFFFLLLDIRDKKSSQFSHLLYEIVEEARMECRKKIDYIRNLEFNISCFSNFDNDLELLKNTTMWSHYANNHNGFCVKYKINFKNIENASAIKCRLFPVKYTSKCHQLSPRELLKLEFEGHKLNLNKPLLKTAFKTLTTKSRLWNYEKEWRLIISSHNSDILTNNCLDFLEVDSIFLGCRIETNLKKHLITIASKNNNEVFQTKQSNERFVLIAEEKYLSSIKEDEFRDKLNQINKIENTNDKLEKQAIQYNKRYSK